jgi:hypothetical protein
VGFDDGLETGIEWIEWIESLGVEAREPFFGVVGGGWWPKRAEGTRTGVRVFSQILQRGAVTTGGERAKEGGRGKGDCQSLLVLAGDLYGGRQVARQLQTVQLQLVVERKVGRSGIGGMGPN